MTVNRAECICKNNVAASVDDEWKLNGLHYLYRCSKKVKFRLTTCGLLDNFFMHDDNIKEMRTEQSPCNDTLREIFKYILILKCFI